MILPLLEAFDFVPAAAHALYSSQFDAWPDSHAAWMERWIAIEMDGRRVDGVFHFRLQRVALGLEGWVPSRLGTAILLGARGTVVRRQARGRGIARALWLEALRFADPQVVDVSTVSPGGTALVLSIAASPEGRRVRLWTHTRECQ